MSMSINMDNYKLTCRGLEYEKSESGTRLIDILCNCLHYSRLRAIKSTEYNGRQTKGCIANISISKSSLRHKNILEIVIPAGSLKFMSDIKEMLEYRYDIKGVDVEEEVTEVYITKIIILVAEGKVYNSINIKDLYKSYRYKVRISKANRMGPDRLTEDKYRVFVDKLNIETEGKEACIEIISRYIEIDNLEIKIVGADENISQPVIDINADRSIHKLKMEAVNKRIIKLGYTVNEIEEVEFKNISIKDIYSLVRCLKGIRRVGIDADSTVEGDFEKAVEGLKIRGCNTLILSRETAMKCIQALEEKGIKEVVVKGHDELSKVESTAKKLNIESGFKIVIDE